MRDFETTCTIPREELLPLLEATAPRTEKITAEIPAVRLGELLETSELPAIPPLPGVVVTFRPPRPAPWHPTVVFASAAIALGVGFGLIAALT